jgi:hypothetical protein
MPNKKDDAPQTSPPTHALFYCYLPKDRQWCAALAQNNGGKAKMIRHACRDTRREALDFARSWSKEFGELPEIFDPSWIAQAAKEQD